MKKSIIIILFGIIINLLVYEYSQATNRDISAIVFNIYLLFIIPFILLIVTLGFIIYGLYKHKTTLSILPKLLISFFLLIILIQFLLFSNDVLVK